MLLIVLKVGLRKEIWWFLGVADTNDVIQKIEKTLNNTHTTTQKLTNNSFRNTKKHPEIFSRTSYGHWRYWWVILKPRGISLLVCTWRKGGLGGGPEKKHFSSLGTKSFIHVNSSRKLVLFWTPTWPPCHVAANQEYERAPPWDPIRDPVAFLTKKVPCERTYTK